MENSSKAIIMAGGVLIAVAIISLALYAYATYRDYANSSEQILSTSQITSFNRYYESFDTTNKVRGIDALNIYKKAMDDHEKDESLQVEYSPSDLISNLEGDSSKFLDEDYVISYNYDSRGKICKVKIEKP